MNETEIAGAGYILKFFEDLEALNNSYAHFVNSITPIKAKVNKEDLKKGDLDNLNEGELNTLKEINKNVRFYMTRCFIKSQALNKKVKDFNNKEMEKLYAKLKEREILDTEQIEKYVLTVNNAFVGGVLEQLLINSKQIYSKLTGGQY